MRKCKVTTPLNVWYISPCNTIQEAVDFLKGVKAKDIHELKLEIVDMSKTCLTCKYFKKHDSTHATCNHNHMMIRSARMQIKYFKTFKCSEWELKHAK